MTKRLTRDEWMLLKRANKFGAKRTRLAGEEKSFPSKLEAKVYAYCKMREQLGQIEGLVRYASVSLSAAGIKYKPDARAIYSDTKQEFWIEAKGAVTERFRMIIKLWKAFGPGPLEIWKENRRGIYLADTVIPKNGTNND